MKTLMRSNGIMRSLVCGLVPSLVMSLVFSLLMTGCAHKKNLSDDSAAAAINLEDWSNDNGKRLNSLLAAKLEPNPVAIFDWDNTIAKNDIGEATFFWLLKNDGLRHPGNWKKQNPYLTRAAEKALNHNCAKAIGPYISTSEHKPCADLLLSIYLDGKIKSGSGAAWMNSHPEVLDPASLWAVQLMAGYSPAEMHALADLVIDHEINNPVGMTQFIGSHEVPAYIHIYDAQKTLIEALKNKGYDVWIVTSSAQILAEVFAVHVGVAPDHVIALRSLVDGSGKLTDTFVGCGPEADGTKNISIYRLGTRCFINKYVFKITDPKAQIETRSAVSFAAGDSDGDVVFLKDARHRLVINRHEPELMCNALQNSDHSWMINPMFIEPKVKKLEPYACKAFGIPDQHE